MIVVVRLALVSVVAACAKVSTSRVVAPDGKPAIEVRCYDEDSFCLRAADDACPKNGYEVLENSDSGWPRGSSAFEASMVIRCNAIAAATKPAAPPRAGAPDRKTKIRRARP
jgi:hypothetical protein